MGYDMYWEREPADDARAPHEQASVVFRAAVKHRDRNGREVSDPADQDAAIAAHEAMARTEFWYFRLNIWGMSVARNELFAAEVMIDVGSPVWPEDEDPDREERSDAERSVLEAVAPGDSHGIPLYKVGSNDGWLVTPGEIETGIGWADKYHAGWRDGLTDYVADFVAWMERAASEGNGFRVY